MQITLFFVALLVWLALFWLGCILFEATGMERRKARFQTISAITGTGFTTTETESVMNHPKRRNIAMWLMFLGATAILACFLVLVFFVIHVSAPSLSDIIIMVVTIVTIVLLIKLGVVDRLTDGIVRFIRKRRPASYVPAEEIVHQVGSYGVARLAISEEITKATQSLRNTGLGERGVAILAIERMDTVIPFPRDDEKLLAGDYLLCYGKVADLI
ncbi:MAG: hypothetical protein WBC82_06260 [Dehalococcoidia bacterium]